MSTNCLPVNGKSIIQLKNFYWIIASKIRIEFSPEWLVVEEVAVAVIVEVEVANKKSLASL